MDVLPEDSEPERDMQDKRARVEEVVDEDAEPSGIPKDPYAQYLHPLAGARYGEGKIPFEEYLAERKAAGLEDESNPWAPFKDEEEWELGRWLLTSGLSQEGIDRYLKLKIVSHLSQPCWIVLTVVSNSDA